MALSDMQSNIADELSRTDLSTQITREINNSITFYQNEKLWFNENVQITINTINGQRDYTLPPNFASILTVRSTLGTITYTIEPMTIQEMDAIAFTNTYVAQYIEYYTLYNGLIRLYPAPTAGLPLYIRGTVLLPTLTTTAATKTWATNTAFSKNDTILDTNGNIQTCVTAGTTQATATRGSYAANTAYSVGDTVIDINDNLQKCTTAGTSGYLLALQASAWATNVNGITPDGSGALQWTLQSTQWSTDFDSYTVDGTVVWQLTTALTNPWMSNAEELIRTRTIRMLYQRYIKDMQQAGSYQQMEKECLLNLRTKNIGQTGLGIITPHF